MTALQTILTNLAILIPTLGLFFGAIVRTIRIERQKTRDLLPEVVKAAIVPVEVKIDNLLKVDRYNLFFYENIIPGLIIDTATSRIISANDAFCKMVKESKEVVEKERFLTYIDRKGLETAKGILDSMREGVKIEGERINFKPDVLGEIWATGNGNLYINIVPDKKI